VGYRARVQCVECRCAPQRKACIYHQNNDLFQLLFTDRHHTSIRTLPLLLPYEARSE
jgi:hypothetical protein